MRSCIIFTVYKIKYVGMGGPRSSHGSNKSAYKVLIGKGKVKRTLGRPRCNGRITLKRILIKQEDAEGTDLVQGRVQCGAFMKAVMNLRVP
jgi:hypothetical protein